VQVQACVCGVGMVSDARVSRTDVRHLGHASLGRFDAYAALPAGWQARRSLTVVLSPRLWRAGRVYTPPDCLGARRRAPEQAWAQAAGDENPYMHLLLGADVVAVPARVWPCSGFPCLSLFWPFVLPVTLLASSCARVLVEMMNARPRQPLNGAESESKRATRGTTASLSSLTALTHQVSADSVSMASEASAAVPVVAGHEGGRRVVMLARHRCSGAPLCFALNPALLAEMGAENGCARCCLLPLFCTERLSSARPVTLARRCAGKLQRFHEMLSLYAGVQAVEDLHATGEARALQRSAPGGEGCIAPGNGSMLDDTRKAAELLVDDILARRVAS